MPMTSIRIKEFPNPLQRFRNCMIYNLLTHCILNTLQIMHFSKPSQSYLQTTQTTRPTPHTKKHVNKELCTVAAWLEFIHWSTNALSPWSSKFSRLVSCASPLPPSASRDKTSRLRTGLRGEAWVILEIDWISKSSYVLRIIMPLSPNVKNYLYVYIYIIYIYTITDIDFRWFLNSFSWNMLKYFDHMVFSPYASCNCQQASSLPKQTQLTTNNIYNYLQSTSQPL